MRAPPPDLSRLGHALAQGGMILLGCALPLLLSALVPNGRQRWGAAVFALLGAGLFCGLGADPATPFGGGLATGFILASAKLATGLRFT